MVVAHSYNDWYVVASVKGDYLVITVFVTLHRQFDEPKAFWPTLLEYA
jgi:hypothetical protein